MLHVSTPNRAAFELLTTALEKIDLFQRSREWALLHMAQESLEQALQKDPDYLGALFYSGIVSDLDGRPADAPKFFEKVIAAAPNAQVHDEALYNLGVAHYHQFSQDHLLNAKKAFRQVIDSTKDRDLRLLAQANLAQAYAMSMHPTAEQMSKRQPKEPFKTVYPEIELQYSAAINEGSLCLKAVAAESHLDTQKRKAITATAQNALGMAEMYKADYVESDQKNRLKSITKALGHFNLAAANLPTDWGNTCDMASAYFRRSVWAESALEQAEAFEKAKSLLNLVLTDLYPGYGFAYYEMGRLLRCHGLFSPSIEQFDKAKAVDAKNRAVSDRRLLAERERAENKDRSFP
jgi:tetratricopeptide (TPR) repeat protein